MKVFEYPFNFNVSGQSIRLRPFFDMHIGSTNCDLKQIKEDVAEVKRLKNCYVILGGDMVEAINPSDKRFEWHGLEENFKNKIYNLVLEQSKQVVEIFKPIKDRLLFLLEGNHEEKCKKQYYFDAAGYIAEELNIPNMGYSCFARLYFKWHKKCSVDIYAHHGIGSGRTPGAKINSIHSFSKGFNADIFLAGHNHGLMSDSSPVLSLSEGGNQVTLKQKSRLFVLCGTYLKTYQVGQSGYGERTGYQPTHIGSPIITIKPFNYAWDKHKKKSITDTPMYWVENMGAK